ncbi:hypothetical protein [Spiroplasma endosymbiont of Othius punctulatus]|uniref:hypothetical protein n=1 Tax=Spiroplasma endosymbiont of Othius punctulatus TaxID=3066289 RepID=UPI0030CFCEF7
MQNLNLNENINIAMNIEMIFFPALSTLFVLLSYNFSDVIVAISIRFSIMIFLIELSKENTKISYNNIKNIKIDGGYIVILTDDHLSLLVNKKTEIENVLEQVGNHLNISNEYFRVLKDIERSLEFYDKFLFWNMTKEI